MVKEMIARRRAVNRRQRLAKALRLCCPETRLRKTAECTVVAMGLLTIAIFSICIVMLAHLNTLEHIVNNPFFINSAIVAFSLWVGVLLLYVGVLKCAECLSSLETDPDEAQ